MSGLYFIDQSIILTNKNRRAYLKYKNILKFKLLWYDFDS